MIHFKGPKVQINQPMYTVREMCTVESQDSNADALSHGPRLLFAVGARRFSETRPRLQSAVEMDSKIRVQKTTYTQWSLRRLRRQWIPK